MTAHICSLKVTLALKATIRAADGDIASREAGASMQALLHDLHALAARYGFELDAVSVPYFVTYEAVPE